MKARLLMLLIAVVMMLNTIASADTSSLKDHYSYGDSGQDVTAIKIRMQELGYYSEGASFNDVYNEIMQERVVLFQKQNGLDETGEIDQRFLDLLFWENSADASEYALETPSPTVAVIVVTPTEVVNPIILSTDVPKPTQIPTATTSATAEPNPTAITTPVKSKQPTDAKQTSAVAGNSATATEQPAIQIGSSSVDMKTPMMLAFLCAVILIVGYQKSKSKQKINLAKETKSASERIIIRNNADREKETKLLSGVVRRRALRKAGYECSQCGASVSNGTFLHVTYRLSPYSGGQYSEDNLCALCDACLLQKQSSGDIYIGG